MKPHPPTTKPKNWKLTVLNSIETMTARKVSSTLGIPESTLNYHLNKWQKMHVIKKVGYGTWEVDQKKKHLVLYPKKKPKQLRKQLRKPHPCRSEFGGGAVKQEFVVVSQESGGSRAVRQDSIASHGFMVVLSIPRLARWDQVGRRKYLESRGVGFVVIPQGERLDGKKLLDWKVWLTNKSLVLYAPKGKRWFVDDAEAGYREIIFEFLRVVKKVESLLGVSFVMGGRYKFKTKREHHALVGNALAAQYTRSGEKLYLRDARGLWGLIDASVEPGELETVRAGVDGRDANARVVDFFNGVKETGVTPEGILEMVHGLAENAKVFGEHMRTHVVVMKNVGGTLGRLNSWLDERDLEEKNGKGE